MGFVTIRDVARQAGVSITAVSQILHGKGRFSQETRDLVQRTVNELGYIPDSRAQAIRSTRSHTIGLLVPDIRNPFFADLVCSVEDMLHTEGYSTLIGTAAEDVARQDEFINVLLGYRIDGAIVVPQGVRSPGITSLVEQQKLPLVFVDRRIPGVDTVPFVVSDPYPGLRQALSTLHQLEHRRIGYVTHPSLGSFSVNERETAFRTITAELFNEDEITVVSCDSTFESRQQALIELLNAGVSAIVFAYSPDAVTMISLLHDKNIDIGTDISVVSFDDIDAFKLMTPQISIISQQVADMGRRGVEMLLSCITDSENSPESCQIPTVFVQRGSVGTALS